MKNLIILSFTLFALSSASAQGCLPEGITFETQTQIDSFQIYYHGCTEIEGDVNIIDWNGGIINLNGLSDLTSIGGTLYFQNIEGLTNLMGLENLTSIGGNLSTGWSDLLTSLTGLDNLDSIGGMLYLNSNQNLTSLSALTNLTFIGGGIRIQNNPALTSLSGLENINTETISELTITDNSSLSTCEIQNICDYLANPGGVINIYLNAPGCNTPTEVANNCGITLSCLPFGNYYFSNQAEIDNFQINYPGCADIEGDVSILSWEEITNLNGLSVITSISGGLSLIANYSLASLTGLNNLTSVGGTLQIGVGYMWFGNPALTSLDGLENLSSVGGDLSLSDDSGLTNLTGLDNLSAIGGNLAIYACGGLNNLIGLENVTYIGGDLDINGNYSLTSLEGLNNLDSVGGNFQLGPIYMSGGAPEAPMGNPYLSGLANLQKLTAIGGYLSICQNDSINDLSGLENVTFIGGDLYIWLNYSLNSLVGLENIYAGSIMNLYITSNVLLSSCDVQSICDYLASPNGIIEIHDNASGCNTQEEVEAACGVGIDNPTVQSSKFKVQSYPNPFANSTNLEYELEHSATVNLSIYNHLGQQVAVLLDGKQTAGKHQVRWDATGMPSGIYYYRLTTDNCRQTTIDYRLTTCGKMVKY